MLCVFRGPDRDLKEMLEVGNKNLKGGKQPLNLCPGPRPFRLRELAEHSATHNKLPSATFGRWSRHGVKLSCLDMWDWQNNTILHHRAVHWSGVITLETSTQNPKFPLLECMQARRRGVGNTSLSDIHSEISSCSGSSDGLKEYLAIRCS